VTGNVDHAELDFVEVEGGKTQFDRDAATLFFGQAVRVHPRERLHEGGLAVVDMARGAEDQPRMVGG
jgi:hypothetical protein